MAIIPNGQKFHTLSSSVDTAERGSVFANANRESYTMQDISNTVFAAGAISGSGTTDHIPVFTGPTTIGASNIIATPGGEIQFNADVLFNNAFQADSGGAVDGSFTMLSGGPINLIDPAGAPTGVDVSINFTGTNFAISRLAAQSLQLKLNGEVHISGTQIVLPTGLINANSDAAAAAAGVPVNGLYRDGNAVQIRLS